MQTSHFQFSLHFPLSNLLKRFTKVYCRQNRMVLHRDLNILHPKSTRTRTYHISQGLIKKLDNLLSLFLHVSFKSNIKPPPNANDKNSYPRVDISEDIVKNLKELERFQVIETDDIEGFVEGRLTKNVDNRLYLLRHYP